MLVCRREQLFSKLCLFSACLARSRKMQVGIVSRPICVWLTISDWTANRSIAISTETFSTQFPVGCIPRKLQLAHECRAYAYVVSANYHKNASVWKLTTLALSEASQLLFFAKLQPVSWCAIPWTRIERCCNDHLPACAWTEFLLLRLSSCDYQLLSLSTVLRSYTTFRLRALISSLRRTLRHVFILLVQVGN